MISMMISLSACLILGSLQDAGMPHQIPGCFGVFLSVCVDILLEKCYFSKLQALFSNLDLHF